MARQTEYMAAYKAKAKQLMEKNGAFINDLYMTMKSDAVTDIPENRISVIANQMYKGEDLGILKIDGKTKLGKVLGDGELHEEFYPDEKSIADCMVKLCGIDEDHITEPDDEDDEDYEEDEEEDDEDEE
jgi:hypothetical protein